MSRPVLHKRFVCSFNFKIPPTLNPLLVRLVLAAYYQTAPRHKIALLRDLNITLATFQQTVDGGRSTAASLARERLPQEIGVQQSDRSG
jgi:hypothetical protein